VTTTRSPGEKAAAIDAKRKRKSQEQTIIGFIIIASFASNDAEGLRASPQHPMVIRFAFWSLLLLDLNAYLPSAVLTLPLRSSHI